MRLVPRLDSWLRWHRHAAAVLAGAGVALLLVLGDLSAALGRIEVPDLPAHSLHSINGTQEAREAWCVWHHGNGSVAAPSQPAPNPEPNPAANPAPNPAGSTAASPAAQCLAEFTGDATAGHEPAAESGTATVADRPAPGLVGWYVGLDVLFVVLYLLLAAGAIVRRRRRLDGGVSGQRALLDATSPPVMSALFGLLLAVELLESAALLVLGSPGSSRWWVDAAGRVLWLAQVKWLLIFLLVLLLVCLGVYRYARLPVASADGAGGPQLAGEDAAEIRRRKELMKAAGLLRFQIIAVLLFCLVMANVGQDQLGDALRRWVDAGPPVAAAAIAATVLLALTIWRSSHRVALFSRDRAAPPPRPVLVFAAAVALTAGAFFWRNLGGLAVILGVVVVLSSIGGAPFWHLRERRGSRRYREGTEVASEHAALVPPGVRANVTGLARWLAVVPVAMLGIALVRSALPAAIFLDSARMWALVVLGIAMLVATPVAVGLMTRSDRNHLAAPTEPVTRHRFYAALAVAAGAAYLLAVAPPSSAWFPVWIGPVATLAMFLVALLVLGTEAQRWSESTTPVAGLRVLGATRNPVITVLVVWAIIGTALDGEGAHGVRLLPDGDRPADIARRGAELTVSGAFDEWRRANCAVGAAEAGTGVAEPVPMVFVASAGGAIRAAYWTAGVLDSLFAASPAGEAGCPASARDRVFALSGVSGGSLGIMFWLTGSGGEAGDGGGSAPWYDEPLTADHLSNVVSWMLNVDAPRTLLGYGGDDRAAALERSWERSQPAMAEPFLSAYGPDATPGWRPLALLNGAAAESGCRALTAPVQLTDQDDRVGTGGCRRPASNATVAPGSPNGSAGGSADGSTDSSAGGSAGGSATGLYDLADLFVCPDQDLRGSTAALLSARFPYVSPTGKLERTRCGTGEAPAGTSATYVVDGGYVDRTGVLTATDLYQQLRGAIEEHNAFVAGCASAACQALAPQDRPSRPIVPVLLRIDNGYASVAQVTDPRRPNELLAPPSARFAVAATMTSVALQHAYQTFGPSNVITVENAAHPGVQAPLGWVMSGSSRDDLCAELARVMGRAELVRQLDRAHLGTPAGHYRC